MSARAFSASRFARALTAFAFAASIPATAGCSWQQAYNTAQGWQRNQCYRLVEQTERERCLGNTTTSYEDYRKATSPSDKG